jgi:hypothetical protein
MPDVNWSYNLIATRGSFYSVAAVAGATADMSESGRVAVTPTLTTSPTTISTASLTSVGLCVIRNLATVSSHTITFGRWDGSSLTPVIEARGSEPAGPFRLAAGSYAMRAAVAGTRAVVEIYEG